MIQGLQIICLRGKVCVFFYTAEALSPGSGMRMGIWGGKAKGAEKPSVQRSEDEISAGRFTRSSVGGVARLALWRLVLARCVPTPTRRCGAGGGMKPRTVNCKAVKYEM